MKPIGRISLLHRFSRFLVMAASFLSVAASGSTEPELPLYRRVADSLQRVRPHETPVQRAILCLDLAEMIRGYEELQSYRYILEAFRIAVGENNDSLKAVCHIRIGDYHNARRRYMQAHEHSFTSWNIARFSKDTAGQIQALINISKINRALSNHEKGLLYLQKALALAERKPDPELEGKLNGEFALLYQAFGDTETSHYFFNKALTSYQKAGNRMMELKIRSDMGSLYLDECRWEEGLAYFTRLLTQADPTDLEMMGTLLTRIGHIYDRKGNNRASLNCNLQALRYRLLDRKMVMVNSSLINVAGDYYDLGMADSGRIYMDSGLVMARRHDRINLMENGYRHLYDYYVKTGDPKQALFCYERFTALREAINRERNRSYIGILEANQQLLRLNHSREMAVKQHNISALNLKYHDNQRMILLILMAVAGVSMIVFVLVSVYFRNVRRKMQEMNLRLSEQIREREQAEEQLKDRETQYKFITDNSIDVITHSDEHAKWLYASPSVRNVYGYEPGEFMALDSRECFHPEDYPVSKKHYMECLNTRLPQQFVFRARRKDGSFFWAESVLIPLFDPEAGNFRGMVGVTRDIQERKTKELQIMEGTKQKENLLKEIHHRVKNNFAILVSLINMQMAQTTDRELLQSLTNLQLRIRTMALVHEMLYRSGDFEKISFPGYLRSLASVIAGTYNRRNIGMVMEADEVVMDIETLIPLGLIVNEILSNAYKHSFPEGRTGTITVRFTDDPSTGNSTLFIGDDGIGMPAGTDTGNFKTMGLQVVQILCSQIEARLTITNNPGATFTLTFRSKRG